MFLGLGLRFGGSGVAGASGGSGITAPVLARTSSDGASPLTWTTTIDSTVYAGYFWRLQIDQTSSAFGAITQDITQMITPSEIAALDGSFPTFQNPSGLYYMRIRVEREDGQVSAWSNVLTDTISVATTTYNPSDKTTQAVLSNGNLTLKGTSGWNASSPARATAKAADGIRYYETTINTFVNNILVGVVDKAANAPLSSGFVPGNGNSLGASYRKDGTIYRNGSFESRASYTAGDVIGVKLDVANNQVTFYKNGTIQGSAITLTIAEMWAFGSCYSTDQITANFGQSAFANLPSGATMYG